MGHSVKVQEFLYNIEADNEEYELIILALGSFEQKH
jgi:creatinine amidohydrolase/Fe(II)-dependent formamide hydrolase-like protein